ncbi:MAG: DUF3135 domain-containing protein [Pseudomonadales bacterium]|nr:DUF3135 domain-containing protein [Pseudomonadales bacterium]
MSKKARTRKLPDFDTLVSMHQADPEALEKLRTELTNEIFDQSPEFRRRRLQGLQFRINMELRRAKTPEARCIKLSTLMHDSFVELHECLRDPFATLQRKSQGATAELIQLADRRSKIS